MATLREVMGGVNRQVMRDMGVQQPLDNSPLLATGAIVRPDAQTSAQLRAGIRVIQAGYVNHIDTNLESNYGNTVYTDIAQPRGIDGGATSARISFQNEAFLESSLEAMLIGQSPLTLMKSMIDRYWTKQFEHRAVATMYGIRNLVMNDADLKADFVLDASKTSAVGDENRFSVDQFIDVEATLDPSLRGAGAMIVHPKVAAKMRKQAVLERVGSSDNLPAMETYNGRVLIEVNSPMTVIGTGVNAQYVSYLMGAGAFVGDSVVGNDDLEVSRTADTGNGAGHTALWTRRNLLVHPQGFNFTATDAQLTGGTKNEALSASWTDLQNKDYWELGTDAKRTSIRFLVTNL